MITMSDTNDDRDELITDLLAESHGLRMKNERISQYTESKISELVKVKRELLMSRQGLETIVEQRNALQGELDHLGREQDVIHEAYVAMTDQRERLRLRLAQLEASQSYRVGQKLLRLFPFLKEKP